jgi:hypothetical protein
MSALQQKNKREKPRTKKRMKEEKEGKDIPIIIVQYDNIRAHLRT